MRSLVFLPGARGLGAFWRPVAERLANLGKATLVGYPGFEPGLPAMPQPSSMDDLLAWLVERLPPGESDVVAQSMGGVLAVRLALDLPERVSSLTLAATSGGVDAASLGAADWRADPGARAPGAPRLFVDDRTEVAGRLADIRAPTLLLWSDSDPVSPPAIGSFLQARIPGARLALVPGGTHAFASERPDEVASLIRSHLQACGGA